MNPRKPCTKLIYQKLLEAFKMPILPTSTGHLNLTNYRPPTGPRPTLYPITVSTREGNKYLLYFLATRKFSEYADTILLIN